MNIKEEAFKMYKDSGGKIKTKEIAERLNISIHTVNTWRSKEKWKSKIKGLFQSGNSNARGHGAPKGNVNNFKHGAYMSEERYLDKKVMAKYLPKEIKNVMEVLENEHYLDKLWRAINVLEAKMLTMLKKIHVKNKDDIDKVLKKIVDGDVKIEEYHILTAIEKETMGVNTLSKVVKDLSNAIKTYDELVNKSWDLITEEQRLRIEVLKSKIVQNEGQDDKLSKLLKGLENNGY